MILSGVFEDINKDKIKIDIVSSKGGSKLINTEDTLDERGHVMLYFSDNPLSIESECEDCFTHVIKKSAKIEFVSSTYLGDYLFADNARDVKVTIRKNDTIIFVGYVTPNIYSMPYNSVYDKFSINCVDFLSTLKYDYMCKNAEEWVERRDNAQIKSFREYVGDIFSLFALKPKVIWDQSRSIPITNTPFWDTLAVSENVFLGDTYNDQMSYDDILFEIMQFCNLHIIQEGDQFYVYDWETVRQENKKKWEPLYAGCEFRYDTGFKNIVKDNYGGDDTNISLDDVFNQIQVKDNIKTVDTVIQNPLDEETMDYNFLGKIKYMTEVCSPGQGMLSFNYYLDVYYKNIANVEYEDGDAFDWYIWLKNNKNWTLNYWTGTEMKQVIDLFKKYQRQSDVLKELYQYKFAPLLCALGKTDHFIDGDKTSDTRPTNNISMSNCMLINVNGNEDDSATEFSNIGKRLENMFRSGRGIYEYDSTVAAAFGTASGSTAKNYFIFSGEICLQMKMNHTVAQETPFGTFYPCVHPDPIHDNAEGRRYNWKFYTDDKVESWPHDRIPITDIDTTWKDDRFLYERNPDGTTYDRLYKIGVLTCQLKVGDKYVVERTPLQEGGDQGGRSTYEWMTYDEWLEARQKEGVKTTIVEESCPAFTIGFDPAIKDYIIGQSFNVENTIDYTMNLGSFEGTAIEIPQNLVGSLSFKILGPVNAEFKKTWRRHPTFFRHTKIWSDSINVLSHVQNIVIKNFTCEVGSNNNGIDVEYDNDIVYYSDMQDKYIEKKDDIEFKINTLLTSEEAAEQQLTAPSVNVSTVIDTFRDLPIGNINNDMNGETGKAEELYIDQYWHYYSQPKMLVETTLKDIDVNPFSCYKIGYLNRDFIPLGIKYNARMANYTLTLRET